MVRRESKHKPYRLRGEAVAAVWCTDPVPDFVSTRIVVVTADFDCADKVPGSTLDDRERIARTRRDVRRVPVNP